MAASPRPYTEKRKRAFRDFPAVLLTHVNDLAALRPALIPLLV